MEKIYHANVNQKKAGRVMPIWDRDNMSENSRKLPGIKRDIT